MVKKFDLCIGLVVSVTVLGMILIGVLHPHEIRSDWGFWLLLSTPILGFIFAFVVSRSK